MARDPFVPFANYAPNANGTPRAFGPFAVDGFTRDDTDYMLLTITPDGPWPTAVPLVTGEMVWGDGSAQGFTLNAPFRSRMGEIMPSFVQRFPVRRTGNDNVKSPVVSGELSFLVHAACRVSVRLQALANASP